MTRTGLVRREQVLETSLRTSAAVLRSPFRGASSRRFAATG